MTKEQLEELIEQEGTVYDIDDSEDFEIELYSKDKCHIVPKYDGEHDYLVIRYANGARYFPISQLMDKKHYEWYFSTHAKRTERFEPPMWDDIAKKDGYLFRFLVGDDFYEFVIFKGSENKCSVFLKNFCTNKLIIAQSGENAATKEDYERACEIVRNLFNKGEEK